MLPFSTMATRILLATDFSEASAEATRQAHAIAARDHAVLGVCHEVPDSLRESAEVPPWLQSQLPDANEVRRRARIALEKQAIELTSGGVSKVEAFLEEGQGHAAIVKRAEEFGADLVVVGSHGRTGLARILLGSVAEKVVRHAHCPVLVARPSNADGVVVTSTDFSDASKPGMRAAAMEAARTGSLLIALNIFPLAWPGATPYAVDAAGLSAALSDTDAVKRATADLDAAIAEATKGLQVDAKGEVLVGDPATLIVQRAEDLQARLVVIATHGRTGLTRALMGSVAERVVRLVHASVLVVRAAPPVAS